MNAPPDPPAAPARDPVQVLWEQSSERLRGWFARQCGSDHDADDLVQETFLRVQARLDSVRDGERLRAWVGAVARNVLADHHRARGRGEALVERKLGIEGLEEPCGSELAEEPDAALTVAVAGWIEAFLARLEPDDEALLRRVELEGRAQSDVARALGLSPSGLRSRVQRARARLRRELEACCRFVFDGQGKLTEAVRRPGSDCGCGEPPDGRAEGATPPGGGC